MSKPVTIEVHPTGIPARQLPHALLFDVATVLEVHGLEVRAAAKETPGVWAELLLALGRIADAIPVEHGGRAES